jgi:uncharacterized protein
VLTFLDCAGIRHLRHGGEVMLFLAIQEDIQPSYDDLRAAARADHIAYLKERADQALLAGPMLSATGHERLGSFTFLSIESADRAEQYIRNDPFTRAGLFASTRLVQVRPGHISPALLIGLRS